MEESKTSYTFLTRHREEIQGARAQDSWPPTALFQQLDLFPSFSWPWSAPLHATRRSSMLAIEAQRR